VGQAKMSSLAHRLRDVQTLPFAVVMNDHIRHVYDLYYRAFEKFRKVPEIKSVEQNNLFCELIRGTLIEHLTVIPKLVMGVIQVQEIVNPDAMDKFVTTMLRSVSLPSLTARALNTNVLSGYPVG
jgi:pyruvate dehydrogenase kinase 2/3/4